MPEGKKKCGCQVTAFDKKILDCARKTRREHIRLMKEGGITCVLSGKPVKVFSVDKLVEHVKHLEVLIRSVKQRSAKAKRGAK